MFIATSLDGFIARPDGGLDWLERPGTPADEDYGYGDFMASVDALVMGRHTFEKVLGCDPWPYGDKRVVVLSSRGVAVPEALARTVSARAGSPDEVLEALAREGVSHVYLDGGVTIQRFLAAGAVDALTLTRIPVLLGAGIPLFGHLDRDIPLEHVETRAWEGGFVQSRYRVARGGAAG